MLSSVYKTDIHNNKTHYITSQVIRELIMATDMAQHNSIMEQFSSYAGNFSFDDEQQVKLVSEGCVC